MSTGQTTVALVELCSTFTDGDWVETKDQAPAGIRLVQTGNVGEGRFKDRGEKARYISETTFNRLNCSEVFAGDCLVSRLPDPVGRACLIPETGERMITAVDCTIIRFHSDQILPEFFVYYSRSIEYAEQINRLTTGTTRERISRSSLGTVQVPVPPPAEQKRIVAVLDDAFNSIGTATAIAEKSLASVREIGRAHLRSALTAQTDGWYEVKLKEVADVESGVGFPNQLQGVKGAQYPFFKVGDMNSPGNERQLVNERHSISEEVRRQLGARVFPVGSVVFPKVGGAIATDKKRLVGRAGCVDNNVMGVIPKPGLLHSGLLHQLLINQPLAEFANDAGLPSIRKTTVEAWRIRLPRTLLEQERLADRLQDLAIEASAAGDLYSRKLACLSELRQSLLARAFSGKLFSSVPSVAVVEPANDNLFATPEHVANMIALGYQRHEAAGRQNTFGRVKAQKNLHLIESVAGIELGRQPWKDAAGPNDFPHMLKVEAWARDRGFFEFRARPDGGYDFKKLAKYATMVSAAAVTLKPIKVEVERVTDLLVSLDSGEAEVLATVHAAWNNLILDGVPVTEEAIVREARDDWHASKLNIAESKFHEAIKLIRKKGIVPDGSAKRVAGQLKLL